MRYSEDTTCDVLFFAAHPGDIEVAMGGTATRLSAEGHSFLIVDLCPGNLLDAELRVNDRNRLRVRQGFSAQTGQPCRCGTDRGNLGGIQ